MKKALCLILSFLVMTSALVFAQAAVTETPTTILNFDTTNNFVVEPAFNSTIKVETTVKTQGAGSMRFGFNKPLGQDANVGGMFYYNCPSALNLSSYDKFAVDIYTPLSMEGKSGIFQINFCNANQSDGINYNFDISNAVAGWNTVYIDKDAFAAHVNGASLSSVSRFRFTWFNNDQITREFFLVDNFRGVVVTGTPDPEPETPTYADTAAAPYKVGNDLMINNADTLDGWNSKDMFNTTLAAGTQIAEGSGSVAITSTIPQGQASNIGAMAKLTFPATDLSSYEKFTLKVHLSEGLAGSQQFQINFITGSDGDGYNYVYNNLGDSSAGWYTITFNRADIPKALSSANWASINAIRITWFNHSQVATKVTFTIDEFKALTAEAHVCTAGTTYQYDGSNHWQTCTGCGAVMNKSAHAGGTATCSVKATCSTCKQAYGSVNASNHVNTEIRNASATYTGDTYCKDCGTKIASGTTITTPDPDTSSDVIVSFDDGQGFTAVNNSIAGLEGTNKTEGAGSFNWQFSKPVGQDGGIGGLLFYNFPSSKDLSSYDTFKLDVYVPVVLGGGMLQVNFLTDANGQDGINFETSLNNFVVGWNTITMTKANPTNTVGTNDWSNINRIRILWSNNPQTNCSYFLLDNLRGVVGGAETPTYSAIAHTPYKVGDNLMINNADTLDGWDSNGMFNTTLSAGTQIVEGSGSVTISSTIPKGQTANIGAMTKLTFPATDLSSYDKFSVKVYLGVAMTGTHQIQINFITGDSGDGYNYVHTFGELPVGWLTITFDRASIPMAASANWSSINAIRITWFNQTQEDIKASFTFDEIMALKNTHVCTAGTTYQYDDSNHWQTCTGCGAVMNKAAHSGGTATCSVKATCSTCKQAYGSVNASKHVNTEIRNAKAATCGAAGYTGDTYCKDCGVKTATGSTIAATGNHTGGEATCVAKAVCSVCSQAYGSLNANNHKHTEIRNQTPTYSGDTYCTDCNTKIASGETFVADVIATVATVNGPFKAGDEIAIPVTISEWANAYATIKLEVFYDTNVLSVDAIEASETDFGGALGSGGNKKFALIMAPSNERQAEKLKSGEVCVIYFVALTDIEETEVSVTLSAAGYTYGAGDNWVENHQLAVAVVKGGVGKVEVPKDTTAPTVSLESVTNNVAATQDVVIKMNDNVGVVGYYFGTSANYADNAYVASTDATATLKVSAAGKYYITVVDAEGNVSETITVVFYMITLNANGGTAALQQILVKEGNTVSLPIATKENYGFAGWATDADATEGVVSITVTANATYYAIWIDNIVYGECTDDGVVTGDDALYILHASVDKVELTPEQFVACDVDGDGQITSVDALYILQYSLGIRTSFPIQGK
ncbi:MAG: InlB B-repeat-containing protein [Clostridia bacterium]|nr:InlB B-repeat-containing protein [Clostridia bacterium]